MIGFLLGLLLASLAYAYLGHGPVLALAAIAGIGVLIGELDRHLSRKGNR